MKKSNKQIFNNDQAYREGWGLFSVDDGTTSIMKLDDPRSIHETYPKDQVFDSDEDALEFVKHVASTGSRYHRKALKLHVDRNED